MKVEHGRDAHGPDMGAGAALSRAELAVGGRRRRHAPRPRPAAAGDASATPATAPSARRAARQAGGRKIDVNAYACVRDCRRSTTGSPRRARRACVAFDPEDHLARSDAGRSPRLLAGDRPGPRRLCAARPPAPAHGDLLGGGLLEGQIPVREALALLKPLLEDPSVLKLARTSNTTWWS